ncbi:MAG: hypothetical protein KTR25_09790 [Myxococcales bacterium]|nr:hypothetical protein [Myxococcales bacterium]
MRSMSGLASVPRLAPPSGRVPFLRAIWALVVIAAAVSVRISPCSPASTDRSFDVVVPRTQGAKDRPRDPSGPTDKPGGEIVDFGAYVEEPTEDGLFSTSFLKMPIERAALNANIKGQPDEADQGSEDDYVTRILAHIM